MIVIEVVKQMQAFYYAIATDARISATHISIYMALLQKWNGDRGCRLELHRLEIMKHAKISARQTYNKCMNELKQYGYIEYMPSRGPGQLSTISFTRLWRINL